jgi:hypothetical protein
MEEHGEGLSCTVYSKPERHYVAEGYYSEWQRNVSCPSCCYSHLIAKEKSHCHYYSELHLDQVENEVTHPVSLQIHS